MDTDALPWPADDTDDSSEIDSLIATAARKRSARARAMKQWKRWRAERAGAVSLGSGRGTNWRRRTPKGAASRVTTTPLSVAVALPASLDAVTLPPIWGWSAAAQRVLLAHPYSSFGSEQFCEGVVDTLTRLQDAGVVALEFDGATVWQVLEHLVTSHAHDSAVYAPAARLLHYFKRRHMSWDDPAARPPALRDGEGYIVGWNPAAQRALAGQWYKSFIYPEQFKAKAVHNMFVAALVEREFCAGEPIVFHERTFWSLIKRLAASSAGPLAAFAQGVIAFFQLGQTTNTTPGVLYGWDML